jgi:phosphatidylserine decarboxylase
MTYLHTAPEYIAAIATLFAISAYFKSKILALIAIITLTLLAAFFRPVGYAIRERSDHVLSPADGKILGITNDGHSHIRISIFLNIHNVHVQYAPIAGRIKHQEYKSGTFHPAYMFQKSALNERMITTLETHIGPVQVIQIAGLVARRIVAFKKPGDYVTQGAPLGLIKLGSRVDIIVPSNRISQILVTKDQRVYIGDPLCKFRM